MKIDIGPFPEDGSDQPTSIHIDDYDTWSMDATLAKIILPMLKKLKEVKHGSPLVDDEDLPEELRTSDENHHQREFDFDDNVQQLRWDQYEVRWNWVMDEMIWAFEQKNTEWEDQFYSGEMQTLLQPLDKDGNPIGDPYDTDDGEPPEPEGVETFEMMRGPNDTFKCDYEKMDRHHNRMKNGFRLFGKYYEGLWD